MDASWLDKYPGAAALLQGDDDVLDYTPDEAPLPDWTPEQPACRISTVYSIDHGQQIFRADCLRGPEHYAVEATSADEARTLLYAAMREQDALEEGRP